MTALVKYPHTRVRIRVESFGAWIALNDGTLVAVSRNRARSLRIDGANRWSTEGSHPTSPYDATDSTPLEAHVAITSQCAVGCEGCYQNATPNGTHVELAQLEQTFASLAAQSVFTVALGGGEPFEHPLLGEIARAARKHGMTVVVTTSGIGSTQSHDLSAFSQVNVSHDGVDGAYQKVRGVNAMSQAEHSITTLIAQGVRVGVNYVLTRDSFSALDSTIEHLAALGVIEVQLLRYKPSGRAASLDYLAKRLTQAQVSALPAIIETLSEKYQEQLSLRVDCALVPFFANSTVSAEQLGRWGVFGCEAGRYLVAINQNNQRKPCSFAHDIPEQAFHDYINSPVEPCTSCRLRSICRGGCKIVSHHFTNTVTADPECPRVLAHSSPPA